MRPWWWLISSWMVAKTLKSWTAPIASDSTMLGRTQGFLPCISWPSIIDNEIRLKGWSERVSLHMKRSCRIWKWGATFLFLLWKAEWSWLSVYAWASHGWAHWVKNCSHCQAPGTPPVGWVLGGFCWLQTSHLACGAISTALLRSYAEWEVARKDFCYLDPWL